jgi:hypothetical protein
MPQIDPDPQAAASDAAPAAQPGRRRPGELAFAALLVLASLYLLRDAWGIENSFGPNGLSSPRAIPVAATAVMLLSAALVLGQTVRRPRDSGQSLARDILPPVVLLFAALLLGYGLLLVPLGFLPTSALFLIVAIKRLGKRGWGWTLAVALGSLLMIWLVFRIVFSVLMPTGLMPEAELLQLLRDLASGGGA